MLGTGTLSTSGGHDTATFATTSLPVGTDAITAVYATTTDFAGSTSSAVNQTVEAPPGHDNDGHLVDQRQLGLRPVGDLHRHRRTGTAAPTGTVTFKDGSTTLGTGTLAT